MSPQYSAIMDRLSKPTSRGKAQRSDLFSETEDSDERKKKLQRAWRGPFFAVVCDSLCDNDPLVRIAPFADPPSSQTFALPEQGSESPTHVCRGSTNREHDMQCSACGLGNEEESCRGGQAHGGNHVTAGLSDLRAIDLNKLIWSAWF